MLHPRAIIIRAYIFACILLRQEGMPCVFHGDLYGIPHDSISPVTFLPRLLLARKYCAHGQQTDYLDAPDIISWTDCAGRKALSLIPTMPAFIPAPRAVLFPRIGEIFLHLSTDFFTKPPGTDCTPRQSGHNPTALPA